jgi:hypothetical protein
MVLAMNKMFSLHELNPDTYCHKTYVLVEMFGSTEAEHRVTLFSAPKMEQLEKLVRSIKNGADGANIELHPLHFVCGFPDYGRCPANERATALAELRLAKEKGVL